eukprot:Phypoly_transcript_21156.p1 GENE.Phypoly_transcript_21156~~Phypoly_transcript_21156.p1  ORF type:complete len:192 (+),score=11.20 Phypoly_transcript_21156:47-622(+)
MNNKVPLNIVDRPLSRGKSEVSLSAFAYLFSELIQYTQNRVSHVNDLERRLADIGYSVGARILELYCFRERSSKRETKLLGILSFVYSTVWKVLFGKQADSLEKSTEQEDEYMISDNAILVNKFISTPKDLGGLNCAAIVAGIVEGILDGAEFPARVTAHTVPVEGQKIPKTVILIKFNPEVIERDRRLTS